MSPGGPAADRVTPAAVLQRPAAVVVAVAAGCALLVARPLLDAHFADPTPLLVMVFAVLLAVGWAWPAPAPAGGIPAAGVGWTAHRGRRSGLVAVAGISAFGAGRLLGGLAPATVLSLRLVVLTSLAAVAEEAFFRRFLYARLERDGGALFAVLGTTLLFAIVHLTVYGAWAMPIDVGAGLLLGWQRWATGSWRVPAITHVVANLLMVV